MKRLGVNQEEQPTKEPRIQEEVSYETVFIRDSQDEECPEIILLGMDKPEENQQVNRKWLKEDYGIKEFTTDSIVVVYAVTTPIRNEWKRYKIE